MSSWKLQGYFVAVIDILGQKDALLSITDYPKTQSQKDNYRKILNDTAGYVVHLRNNFLDFFKKRNENTGRLARLNHEARLVANYLRGTNVRISSFSDTVVISVPLPKSSLNTLPMTSIHSALYALCGLLVISLAERKPFRCGVDIGPAVELPTSSSEIYGPGLVKAYLL